MHLCIYIYKDSWKRAFFDQLCKTYFVNKYEQTLKENKNGPPPGAGFFAWIPIH